jgi:hypothetical protein
MIVLLSALRHAPEEGDAFVVKDDMPMFTRLAVHDMHGSIVLVEITDQQSDEFCPARPSHQSAAQ